MENNGKSLSSLAERLRAKTEQETREIGNLTRQQFENLNRNLSESSKNALSTTESVIRSNLSNLETEISLRCRIMSKAFGKTCLQAGLAMFGLILALGLMGWAMLSLFRGEAQDLRQEIAALKTGKEAWERDFPPIQRAFPGLALHQQNGKSYLVLPEGMKVLSTGTLGSREALEIGRK
jgi:hypothetical protein